MPSPAARFVIALLALSCADLCAQPLNIIFYGNSYSYFNGGVADIVRLIAVEAGEPAPTVVPRLVGGQNLHFHATDPAQLAAIANSLPSSESWDVVVMQGHSLEATSTLGNPALFRQRAVDILANVRAHSPGARAVMYQTWARAASHAFYPTTFADPLTMHAQIRDSYRDAVAAIDATHGTGAGELARVGDAMALLEWQDPHYHQDLTHPGPRMTLLAAMCLFSAIYDQRVCDLQPNLQGSGALASWLANHAITAADWQLMAPLADRSCAPSLRAHPGSGDHLLLESGSPPGPVDACDQLAVGIGDNLTLRVSSKNGVFAQAPGWLLANVTLAGTIPPPSPIWPELRIDTGSMLILATSADLSSPLGLAVQMPFSFPGLALLVQGIAFGPSTTTANGTFATTDGHVLTFQ